MSYHSLLEFFDNLSNARLVMAPMGMDNAVSIVILTTVAIHCVRTCIEIRERRRQARKIKEEV
jgi:hypothetical protein